MVTDLSLHRLGRLTKNLFNEKVEFDNEADEKFQQQLVDLEEHFREVEEEDNRVNVNHTEVANATMMALNAEIDKFNAELRKKNKDGGNVLKEGELNDLEQSQSGTMNESPNKQVKEEFASNPPVEEVFKEKIEFLRFNNKQKELCEEDPLFIDIETISKLLPTTKVFKEEHTQEEKAAPHAEPETKQQNYMFDNFTDVDDRRSILRKEMQQVLETSLP